MTIATRHGCIPSCFGWDNQRDFVSDRYRRGYMQNIKTGQRFGIAFKHSTCNIRITFGRLFIVNPLLTAIRMPLRVVSLLSGDFARRGRDVARREWELERQAWSLYEHKHAPPPSRGSLRCKIVVRSLCELVKNIIKIVLYPLAMVAFAFAALYGCIIHPLDGMQMWSAIEHAWSRDGIVMESRRWHYYYRATDYIAICMQPENVWHDVNFYTFASSYPTHNEENDLREIQRKLQTWRLFFNREFENEFAGKKSPVDHCLEWVSQWLETNERARFHFVPVLEKLDELRAVRSRIAGLQIKMQKGGDEQIAQALEQQNEKKKEIVELLKGYFESFPKDIPMDKGQGQ